MRAIMRSIALLLLGLHVAVAAEPAKEFDSSGAFEYSDCADQKDGVPLIQCAKLRIAAKLDQLSFGDVVENLQRKSSDLQVLSLDSGYFPIAIPAQNYERTQTWQWHGKNYKKVKHGLVSTLNNGSAVDVIVVTDNQRRDVLSFWYSPTEGVRAIGIPQSGVDSGKVYYCESRCLFVVRNTDPR